MFKKWPYPLFTVGLELTIHVIKSQIHLVRQSLKIVNFYADGACLTLDPSVCTMSLELRLSSIRGGTA
jgi:hypothetical protein